MNYWQTNYWLTKVTIGNRSYPRFMGGPLDGYTDSPFRRVVRIFSPENLLYTQIRHVATLAHAQGSKKSLLFDPIERPLQFQITANSIQGIELAVQHIQAVGVDGIDLNIACPAKNVVKSCSGSAVMANVPLLEQILRLLRATVNVPLTIKMRAGFKAKNALDVVKLAQDCGVDAIAIHPRLQTQKFSGGLDYDLVHDIKKSVKIPVLYSGGIINFSDAQMVYEHTGADGFLIGRALCGTPWKLAELGAHAIGKAYTITPEQRVKVAGDHLKFLGEYYGPRGVYHFRKHLPGYIAGFEGAAGMRKQLMTEQSAEKVLDGLQTFLGVSCGEKEK